MNSTQECSVCQILKPVEDFEVRSENSKRRRDCRSCRRDYANRWYDQIGRVKAGRAKRVGRSSDDMEALAAKKGGTCLTPFYINSRAKYTWRCAVGHEWAATYNKVVGGRWCPRCARNVKRTIGDLQAAAAKRGGRCLSTRYVISSTPYEWECAAGHRWLAPWNSIQQKRWCLLCSGLAPLGLDRLRQHAKDRGGECLSLEYASSRTKYEWRCDKGHRWFASADNVLGRQRTWCPRCSYRISAPQHLIFDVVAARYPDAQLNPRGILSEARMELDIYVPSLKKAVEYDGAYWHDNCGAKERDSRKELVCAAAGIRLLRVGDTEYLEHPGRSVIKVLDFLADA